MPGKIAIGEAWKGRSVNASAEVKSALSRLLKIETAEIEDQYVYMLAGPNDLIQLLLDNAGAIALGTYLLEYYGTKLLDHIHSPVDESTAPAEFSDLLKALRLEHDAGNTVSFGLRAPGIPDGDMQRGDRVEIDDFTPELVAQKLVIFANGVDVLSLWVKEQYAAANATTAWHSDLRIVIKNEILIATMRGRQLALSARGEIIARDPASP